MGKLAAAQKKRVAASNRCYITSAKRYDLDDDMQHGTRCAGNILEIIQNAKRRKFGGGGL